MLLCQFLQNELLLQSQFMHSQGRVIQDRIKVHQLGGLQVMHVSRVNNLDCQFVLVTTGHAFSLDKKDKSARRYCKDMINFKK